MSKGKPVSAVKDIGNFLKFLGVPPRVTTEAEYNRLKSGDKYIDDKGNQRTKR